MRTFIAIFPPLETRKELLRTARNLNIRGEVRWTKPENVHLTLKFLGEVREEYLAGVGGTLREVAARHETFEIEAGGFGAFPSAEKARVLWAGVGGGEKQLRSLAGDVENALEPLGFERESRAYTPHITLGRAGSRSPVALMSPDTTPPGKRFVAQKLELVRSVLGRDGVVYSTVEACGLHKGRGKRSDGHDDEE